MVGNLHAVLGPNCRAAGPKAAARAGILVVVDKTEQVRAGPEWSKF